MNFDFLEDFQDPYLKTDEGKGVFLSGVLLGYMAYLQGGESDVRSTPLFKQIQFGKLTKKSLQKILSRVPQLVAGYEDIGNRSYRVNSLLAEIGRLLLSSGNEDLGTSGNFSFTVGFVNSGTYINQIFAAKEKGEDE
ncbi:MAG TPA: CRISPR-associated protein [Syntrophothermus lipocalidus]|nr:CRISPR-associated protein [Syntrophothermus lipocalidus]